MYIVRLLLFTITMISHHLQEDSADFIGLHIRFSNPMQMLFQSLGIIKSIPRWTGKLLSENDGAVVVEKWGAKNFEWFSPRHVEGNLESRYWLSWAGRGLLTCECWTADIADTSMCAYISYYIINFLLLKSTFHVRLVFVFVSQGKCPDITTSVLFLLSFKACRIFWQNLLYEYQFR